MKRKSYKVIIIIISMIVLNIIIYDSYSKETFINGYYNNNSKYNYERVVHSTVPILEIPKIKLYNKVQKANKDFSNLDRCLVYYKNINPEDKIIIFGHSGMGLGVYFNKLDILNLNDKVYLNINNKVHTYIVKKKYLVDEKNIEVLKEEKATKKILLITCDKKNKSKRLVIEATKI